MLALVSASGIYGSTSYTSAALRTAGCHRARHHKPAHSSWRVACVDAHNRSMGPVAGAEESKIEGRGAKYFLLLGLQLSRFTLESGVAIARQVMKFRQLDQRPFKDNFFISTHEAATSTTAAINKYWSVAILWRLGQKYAASFVGSLGVVKASLYHATTDEAGRI